MDHVFIRSLHSSLSEQEVTLVAVSKTKPLSLIEEMYDLDIRHFGENRPQELVEKHEALPKDIKWHMIGNLQKNKVKYIAPFVHLIHSVSSAGLLKTINKEAQKNDRTIDVLLQIKIANEDTKSGLDVDEAQQILTEITDGQYPQVNVKGFMGMATFTDDREQVRSEFRQLRQQAEELINHTDTGLIIENMILSMGMSGDYKLAIEEGSNMVRIGSLLFGAR